MVLLRVVNSNRIQRIKINDVYKAWSEIFFCVPYFNGLYWIIIIQYNYMQSFCVPPERYYC